MSKKYFVNNLDTSFGQALIEQLVKEPTEDPVHMCTTRAVCDAKPQGIKKILKREKPKLFRKKAIEQCDVFVYNLEQTELSDIEFGIEMMLRPFEESKVFILVSDIMAWSGSGRKVKKDPPPPQEEPAQNAEKSPENADPDSVAESQGRSRSNTEEAGDDKSEDFIEEKPIEYTFWQDNDYMNRMPLAAYSYIKDIEDKVLTIKKENVKVFIICPGAIYGCGQQLFYPLFKAAWLQEPAELPYLGTGTNRIPTIHLRDLVRFVVRVAENPPEGVPYLLAFDQTNDKSQKALIQAISTGVGSGKVGAKESTPLIQNPDRYSLDVDIRASKVLIGTVEEPVDFEWVARKGICENIKQQLAEFSKKEHLRAMKLLFLQSDQHWKDSKIDYILSTFSQYYRVPVLTIQKILQQAKQLADQELTEDLKEEWTALMRYIDSGKQKDILDETMKVFYRAIKWRMSQNDCSNRGFILYNFPRFQSELDLVFTKVTAKKLKRIRPKKPVKAPEPAPPSMSQKTVISSGDVEKEQQIGESSKEVPPQIKQEQEAPKEEEAVQQQPQEEGEDSGPKFEHFYPQSVISIKKMGMESEESVVQFFTSKGMEELVYNTIGRKEHEIFESLRSYIQRNGRPNNYLVSEQELLKRHKYFVQSQNEHSLKQRSDAHAQQSQLIQQQQQKRSKLCEQISEIVRSQGEEEIKKMPFRNYLMQFVVPTLNMGLLEVSNIIPNDPVDLLAEFLYTRSYEV